MYYTVFILHVIVVRFINHVYYDYHLTPDDKRSLLTTVSWHILTFMYFTQSSAFTRLVGCFVLLSEIHLTTIVSANLTFKFAVLFIVPSNFGSILFYM